MTATAAAQVFDITNYVPSELRKLVDPQKDLPRIAKDPALVAAIEANGRVADPFATLRKGGSLYFLLMKSSPQLRAWFDRIW
jgi:hypothetical protein